VTLSWCIEYAGFACRSIFVKQRVLRHLALALSVAVYIFPNLFVDTGELIWGNSDDITVL
jgi:hypothetical protein